MNAPPLALIALSLGAALAISGCGKIDEAHAATNKPNPTETRISEDTVIKKVCLDGVSYYATRVTDAVDSIMGKTYWVVGGAVFAKDRATPVECEK